MKPLNYDEIIKMMNQNALENRIPLNGDFELTGRCNLKCKMCYVVHDANDEVALNHELSTQEWLRIAKEARDAGMLVLLLTGGEIFLRRDFKEIYEGISEMGFLITLNTNGTLINEEIANWLAKRPPSLVSITMYGASPETYEAVTGHRNGYERVIRAIQLLQERNIKIEIKTSIIKQTVCDIETIFEYANSRDIHFGMVNYIFPKRCSKSGGMVPEQVRLSPTEIVDYEGYIENYIGKKLNLYDEFDYNSIELFETEANAHQTSDFNELCVLECNAGSTSVSINWKGEMVPCNIMSEPKVTLKNHSFNLAFSELQRKIAEIVLYDECKTCDVRDYCMTCAGRILVETGAFNKKPVYLCENARYRASK
jgi:radical SAM protein with 4Fe4S-binding SPASM domain